MSYRIQDPAALSPPQSTRDRSPRERERQREEALRRLAAGLRVPSTAAAATADDASGATLTERLRARIRSLDRARRDANDGFSLTAVADAALSAIGGLLVRMRELVVRAGNDAAVGDDIGALQVEFSALRDAVDDISQNTAFAGTALFVGDAGRIQLQVGSDRHATIDIITLDTGDALTDRLRLDRLELADAPQVTAALLRIDRAGVVVQSLRGSYGAAQERLRRTISGLCAQFEPAAGAASPIGDAEVAFATAAQVCRSLLADACQARLVQARIAPEEAVSLLSP